MVRQDEEAATKGGADAGEGGAEGGGGAEGQGGAGADGDGGEGGGTDLPAAEDVAALMGVLGEQAAEAEGDGEGAGGDAIPTWWCAHNTRAPGAPPTHSSPLLSDPRPLPPTHCNRRECARCFSCDVVPRPVPATPPASVDIDSLPLCPRCRGCTHSLEPFSRAASWGGRELVMHIGNTGASLFTATNAEGEVSLLKIHGLNSSQARYTALSGLGAD